MITIEPLAGLGNRMRALDSAILLSQEIDCKLSVIWKLSSTLYCPFHELFEIPDFLEVKSKKSPFYFINSKKLRTITNQPLRFVNIYFPPGYEKYLFDNEITVLKSENFDFKNLKQYKSIYIKTLQRFYINNRPYSNLKPIGKIQDKIDLIINTYSKNTIGVHIRRGDHNISKQSSPIEEFIKKMKNEIELNNNTNFFLATDSEEEEKKIRTIFKDRIISYSNKKLSRMSYNGIQDALIDLMCLSRTKKIFGSFWSSYSEIAAEINNIELTIIKTNSIK